MVSPKLPWAQLLTLTALATIVAIVLRLALAVEVRVPWSGVLPVVVAASMAFLVERWFHNGLWGVIAALVLAFHPLVYHWARQDQLLLWAEALGLVVVGLSLASWRLLFSARFSWVGWGLVTVLLPAAMGLAWTMQPRIGLAAALLTVTALFTGTFLAFCLRKVKPISWANMVAGALLGVLAPVAGTILAVHVVPQWADFPQLPAGPPEWDEWDLIQRAVSPEFTGSEDHGFAEEDRQRWGWPLVGAVLPLMIWGLWRSLRRGRKEWKARRPPMSWVLTLYVVLVVAGVALHPASARATEFLSLAFAAVFLVIFCVADLVRGIRERLVLQPPT